MDFHEQVSLVKYTAIKMHSIYLNIGITVFERYK